ncbi:MAG: hypothetical protein F4077_05565, partial [Gammaproteobacteria bacterium]|nr:hypothetical protein [Gammaproteobacteria bacterium]
MKMVRNDMRLLVIAFIGSLIFHTLVIFAIDFRFESHDGEPRVLNVLLVPQTTEPSVITGTPEQESGDSPEISESNVANLTPDPVSEQTSSPQDNGIVQLDRDSALDSDESTEITVPNVEVSETPTEVINVLEPNPTSNELPQVSMHELLKTATAIAREQSSEETVRNIEDDDATNTEEEFYLKAWLKKVQEIGQLNYPQEAVEKKLYGKLRLYVSIKPDGSVKETRVVRSSGHE